MGQRVHGPIQRFFTAGGCECHSTLPVPPHSNEGAPLTAMRRVCYQLTFGWRVMYHVPQHRPYFPPPPTVPPNLAAAALTSSASSGSFLHSISILPVPVPPTSKTPISTSPVCVPRNRTNGQTCSHCISPPCFPLGCWLGGERGSTVGSSGKEEVEDEAGSGRARGRGSEILQLLAG